MEHLHYNVARHSFVIAAPQSGAVSLLLPSYHPFLVAEAEPTDPIFTLTLTPEKVTTDLPFYTSFDWDEAHCKVYRNEQEYAFEILPHGNSESFRITCDSLFSQATLQLRPEEPLFAFALGNFIMMLYAFSSAPQDTLLLHASVIRYQGKGYLFQGKSGTGKSTHSSLWLRHIPGTELLNDDNPVLRIIAGKAYVFGSPWSGKTPCYRNEEALVGAFVRLAQAPFNQISRQGIAPSFASLLPSCSNMKWDKRINDAICQTVGLLATTVPAFRLECLPDEEAARLCMQSVTQ